MKDCAYIPVMGHSLCMTHRCLLLDHKGEVLQLQDHLGFTETCKGVKSRTIWLRTLLFEQCALQEAELYFSSEQLWLLCSFHEASVEESLMRLVLPCWQVSDRGHSMKLSVRMANCPCPRILAYFKEKKTHQRYLNIDIIYSDLLTLSISCLTPRGNGSPLSQRVELLFSICFVQRWYLPQVEGQMRHLLRHTSISKTLKAGYQRSE